MTEQHPDQLEQIPDQLEVDPTPDPAPEPAPEPAPAPTPAKPARAKRSSTPAEVDPHAGHAVYNLTLQRFVGGVFRGDSAEADATAEAKAEAKRVKGQVFEVRAV